MVARSLVAHSRHRCLANRPSADMVACRAMVDHDGIHHTKTLLSSSKDDLWHFRPLAFEFDAIGSGVLDMCDAMPMEKRHIYYISNLI